MGLFWSVIGNVQSDLELSQWRGNLLELVSVLTHHVFTSVEGGLIHLDCGVAYEIADVIQTGLTAVCKIQARIAGEIPTIECALGWVQHNRYCRVRTPEGLIGHNGPAALGFLHFVNVARNAIRGLMPNRPNQALDAIQPSAVPGFRIDMSWLVIDRESECYLGLRSIFSSLVAITAFMPLVEPELNDIMAYHMAIALPASVIDGLMSGGATAIPTPSGQLNPCYGIDSCLRKLSQWYFQDCFSSTQCKEFVKIVIYKPLHLRQTTALKRPDGYGGYANFHNCAFTGFS